MPLPLRRQYCITVLCKCVRYLEDLFVVPSTSAPKEYA